MTKKIHISQEDYESVSQLKISDNAKAEKLGVSFSTYKRHKAYIEQQTRQTSSISTNQDSIKKNSRNNKLDAKNGRAKKDEMLYSPSTPSTPLPSISLFRAMTWGV